MNEMIINNIFQNKEFSQYKIKNEDHKIEIENDHYIISIMIYHCQIAEEMIYDKLNKNTFFYLHHDCSQNQHTVQFINDFLNIALDLTQNES